MVSLKYETEVNGDCISQINGANLCEAIKRFKIYIGIDLVFIAVLYNLRKKIIQTEFLNNRKEINL